MTVALFSGESPGFPHRELGECVQRGRKISNVFEEDGQFWDIQRNLWLGRKEI
jgi:hypothetical protein